MPPQKKITIVSGLPNLARFDPPVLPCSINDQIYWANSDNTSHWPALLRRNGSLDENYFLEPVQGADGVKRNLLPPNSTSATFSPGVAGVLQYVCRVHQNETGSISVLASVFITGNPQAGGPALYNITPLPPAVSTPLPVAVGASVTWINNDTQPHWPAPVDGNGNVDKNGFMASQIPPGGSSPAYLVKAPGTIKYVCVLHNGESGSLVIGEPE